MTKIELKIDELIESTRNLSTIQKLEIRNVLFLLVNGDAWDDETGASNDREEQIYLKGLINGIDYGVKYGSEFERRIIK